jgi:hypothetical protein
MTFKEIEYKYRLKRNGIPILRGLSHEILRGRHQGASILVHGNGPSSTRGYSFAREHIGENLVVIGMNASGQVISPDYYVIVDRKATLRYADLLDAEKMQILITQNALALVNREFKRSNKTVYRHIVDNCLNSSVLTIKRKKIPSICPRMTYLPGTSANAGIISICLALMMIQPELTPEKDWATPIRPGRLIVTGLDGYDLKKQNRHHIDPSSPLPSSLLNANLLQSGFMSQLFFLAEYYGHEIWNLCSRDILPVNQLFRYDTFDREQ